MPNEFNPSPTDMSQMRNRLDLVNRYNKTVGPPGSAVRIIQQDFVNGLMMPERLKHYVQQCEYVIASFER